MCRMPNKLLASVLLSCGLVPAANAAAVVKAPAASAALEQCGTDGDIEPQSAIRDRYQGADGAAFLLGVGAIDEARPLRAGQPAVFDPVRNRLGRAKVARRSAGLPIRVAALDRLAAKSDAEAQPLAGSHHETMVPGAGCALIEAPARQGLALAMLELGYFVAGLDRVVLMNERAAGAVPDAGAELVPVGPNVPPVQFQSVVPGMDRVLGNCWLKAAVAAGDGEIAAPGTTWLGDLAERMNASERDSARALWDRSAGASPAEMCL